MTKKSSKLKLSSDFWKGLFLGVVLAAISVFIYFKFFSPSLVPPENLLGNENRILEPLERIR